MIQMAKVNEGIEKVLNKAILKKKEREKREKIKKKKVVPIIGEIEFYDIVEISVDTPKDYTQGKSKLSVRHINIVFRSSKKDEKVAFRIKCMADQASSLKLEKLGE